MHVSPKVSANAFQDDWLPQLEKMQEKCPLLLKNMALKEVKMSENTGAARSAGSDVWYRQMISFSVVYQNDTGVTFFAEADIMTPLRVIQEAFEKDEKTFKDLDTKVTWTKFRMECE